MICLTSAASAASAAVDSGLSDGLPLESRLEEIEARGTVRRDLAGAVAQPRKATAMAACVDRPPIASAAQIIENPHRTDTASAFGSGRGWRS
jgi:hypothetical protein